MSYEVEIGWLIWGHVVWTLWWVDSDAVRCELILSLSVSWLWGSKFFFDRAHIGHKIFIENQKNDDRGQKNHDFLRFFAIFSRFFAIFSNFLRSSPIFWRFFTIFWYWNFIAYLNYQTYIIKIN